MDLLRERPARPCPRRAAAVLGALLLGLAPAGCKSRARLDPTSPPDGAVAPDAGAGSFERGALAQTELGAHEEDERARALADTWPSRVARAIERLGIGTGLGFARSAPPDVVLAPLGDEEQSFSIGSDVAGGLRRTVLRVNVEPLASGRADPDRTLLEALATAVFEETSVRGSPVPAWVAAAAATVAAGDVDERVARIRRRLDLGDETAARVDSADPRAAEATGLGAVLLLLRQQDPSAARTWLGFVADGDLADALLARTIRDPQGTWIGSGREALEARLRETPPTGWRLLPGLDASLASAGRAGLLSAIPAEVPEEIVDEVHALRAQAAAEEGDWAATRTELDALSPDAPTVLRDPGGAALLRLSATEHVGEESEAGRLEEAFRRDWPVRARSAGLQAAGRDLDPRTADLAVAERHLARLLVQEHRAGAARRWLERMGDRGDAPELAGIARAIAVAEREPSDAALEANLARARAWVEAPGDATERAVVDGGTAAARGLASMLPPAPGAARDEAVRLLARAGGSEQAVPLLAPAWRERPDRLARDLESLLAVLPLEEVRVFARASAGNLLDGERGEAVWSSARLGLDEDWLRAHPQVLRDLHDERYAARRSAFDLAIQEGQAAKSPLLVAHALRDPAALLRRDAAVVAGQSGFRALLAAAIEDEAWIVRRAAVSQHRLLGTQAVPVLLARLHHDPSAEVRVAAAHALMEIAPGDSRVLAALVATQGEEDPRLREDVAAHWTALPRVPLARALAQGIQVESARNPSRSPVLFRLFIAFQRTVGRDLGYHPGLARAEVAKLAAEAGRRAEELR